MNGIWPLFPPNAIFAISLLIWLMTAIVHVGFACAVFTDSGLMWRRLRRNTFLVGGGIWALATLLGGVFVAAVYWLIHHSTLRPPQRSDASLEEPAATILPPQP